ncbi:MAG: serine/threonine protein kinase [Planctomycetaceae bacterium]|nr:serine/threonine protein kinase [Planctomycetaceae bacterium]
MAKSEHPDEAPIDETRLEKSTTSESAGKSAAVQRSAGTVLGEFRLLRPLGKGGMAEVWLAEQTTLRRNVALKLLRPDMMEDQSHVQRFQTEAKAAAGLNHSNIVQVYTFGFESGQHYIAQEYVDGQTLKAFLKRRGPLDVNMSLYFMRQVLSAMAAAGERGIIHRDIKPENIMITRRGEAKVADFGLAQLQGGERLNLTQEGVTMGTPLYMSPEQVQGKKLDQRSDLYSFGVTCYHMLAGRPPFEGDNAVAVAFKHLQEKAQPLGKVRPDVPKVVCDVISKMMARDPEDRYPDAQSALLDVRRIAKALKTGEEVDVSESTGTVTVGSTLPRARFLLPALCLLTALLAAGLGWFTRMRMPPVNPDALNSAVQRQGTARDQYIKAMLEVDNAEGFRAVTMWFPNDAIWVNRAHEQLALIYLKDPQQKQSAEQELDLLESFRSHDERFYTEAFIGRAALNAYDGKLADARRLLQRVERNKLENVSPSWRNLEADIQRLIDQGAT